MDDNKTEQKSDGQMAAAVTSCPRCKASPGFPCRNKNFKRLNEGRRSHPERMQAFRRSFEGGGSGGPAK